MKILKINFQEEFLMKKRILALLACGALAASAVTGMTARTKDSGIELTV